MKNHVAVCMHATLILSAVGIPLGCMINVGTCFVNNAKYKWNTEFPIQNVLGPIPDPR